MTGTTLATSSYDSHDNRISVTDARNHATASSFDDLGRIRSVTSPDTGTTNATYDQAGNLLTLTDAKGQTITATYDALNRPLTQKKGDAFISSASGSCLNQSVTTSSTGEAAYNLADGSYRVTANYLGYEYSTDPFTVPLIASQTLAIPHLAHTVSVVRSYQNNRVALANIEATLCTVDGTPLALTAATGADVTLQWSLPAQAYAVQARYLGRTYLSEPFTSGNPTVLIPEGLARMTLLLGGAALPNTQVVAISDSDPDHPQSLTSDASGVAFFAVEAGTYRVKAWRLVRCTPVKERPWARN